MPTYDYECGSCGHTFEQFQSMTAKPKKKCPECGSSRVRRVISSSAGIILKGSGFYNTDYRKKTDVSDKKDKPSQCGKSDACASCEMNA